MGDGKPVDNEVELRALTMGCVARLVWFAMLLAVAGTAGCWWAAGAGMGLFFGGFAIATLITPPLCAAENTLLRRLLVVAAVVDGIGLTWLAAALGSDITLWQWFRCYLLLLTYTSALGLLATALADLRLSAAIAAAVAVVVGLLWLSWPVWMAPMLAGRSAESLASALVAPHPLLVVNGILPDWGVWLTNPLSYDLTNLGDDVPYSLPASPWLAVGLHGAVATVLATASSRRARQ